jgi:uncharacterized membrane protein YphA (DoxX/SURF4 family)
MRIKSWGHVAFALTMVGLGIMGLVKGAVTPVWDPIPKYAAAATPILVYLCALVSLGCGIGLLFERTATVAARVLFGYLLFWLLVFRLPLIFMLKPLLLVLWTCASTSVVLAAAWVLYVWLGGGTDKLSRFATGESGLRIARVLYGLGMIPFGLAHFAYLKDTVVLIPNWPAPTAWAYFTGGAFVAAGLAMVVGVVPRLAAALSTLQMALFLLIIWVPRVLSGNVSPFQWGEFVTNIALVAAAWVVTDSYRGVPWLAVGTARSGGLVIPRSSPAV